MGLTELYTKYLQTDGIVASQYMGKNFPIRNCAEELQRLLTKTEKNRSVLEKAFGNGYVKNWLEEGMAISREYAIKILIALGVTDIVEAEEFIMHSCGHEGFYARSYRDCIYRFCIEKNLGINKMKELIDSYKWLDSLNPDASFFYDDKFDMKNGSLTYVVLSRFEDVDSEPDLDVFFNHNRNYFGNFNRTAYKHFISYYDYAVSLLERWKSESLIKNAHADVSIEEVCRAISNKPTVIAKENLTFIKEILIKDEPHRKRLSNVLNKKENVPRKYMVLFFLWANGEIDYEESIQQLNNILIECGMPYLDSRNPFDWIVMNSIYYASKPDSIGANDRIKEVYELLLKIT